MQLIVLLILSIASTGNCKCNTHRDCYSCANSKSGLISCRWCERTKTCHQPGSIYNVCHGCKESSISCSVTDPLKCGTNTVCDMYGDCLSCANTNYGQTSCRWCPTFNSCHAPGSSSNECDGCRNYVRYPGVLTQFECSVTDPSKCGRNTKNVQSDAVRSINEVPIIIVILLHLTLKLCGI